ncbi:thioredoxin domain-containing protein 12-like [Clavelina lepadiformis]|uniref:thioredoxin domain-containing protein 12-like n=1 Tax=Clavelina lepadiformis TaxID=159417 RepID=UPI004041B3C2
MPFSVAKILSGVILLLTLCQVSSTIPMQDFSLDRGFGSHLNWTSFDQAIRSSVETRRPIMLLLHQKWCKACRDLMPKFRANRYIEKLSPLFEMVNLIDDEVPKDPKFAPDGSYFPRIFFISPEGEVMTDIYNPEAVDRYFYYYYEADSVARSMLKAVHKFYNVADDDDSTEL